MSAVVFAASFFFFFNDTATTEIYTLSLHDALPISARVGGDDSRCADRADCEFFGTGVRAPVLARGAFARDRKSTRLNSSHGYISYAVFCLKKKKRSTCEPHRQETGSSTGVNTSMLL